MKPIKVEITKEALQKHATCDVYDALAQIIFNSIDSSATRVDINFEYEKCGLDNGDFSVHEISSIVIKDNGTGIPFAHVEEYFKQYNKSWKKDKKRPDGRPYQGRQGIGRFKYLSLGTDIKWSTCYKNSDGKLYEYSIESCFSEPESFPWGDEVESKRNSTGTEVTISNISLNAQKLKNSDRFAFRLAELVGLYIKSDPDFTLNINGSALNPDDFIDGENKGKFVLNFNETEYIFDYHFIVWKPAYNFKRHKHTFLFDKSFNYKGAFASGVNAADSLPYHTVFLLSDFFSAYDEYSSDFMDAATPIKKAYRERLLHFLYEMRKKRSKERFKIFSEAEYYPFAVEPKNEVEAAERNLFDLCAFSILEHEERVLSSKKSSLILLFKLLRKFIEKDASIADNLSEVLELSPEEATDFQNICKSTPLPALIQHYNEILRRETFLDVLDSLVHKDFYKKKLKERTQLHKIVEQETWIFGDKFDYNLSNSDQSLTNVLKSNLKIQELSVSEIEEIEKGIEKDAKKVDSYLKKIPDLYMWKTIPDSIGKRNFNLIVELKAPNVPIGVSLQKQAMDIYRGIAKTTGVEISENNKWEYWLVSSDITADMEALYQGDNPQEQILQDYLHGNYRVYCRTWNRIIREARFKLTEQKRGLEIKIQEEQKNNLLDKYLAEVNFMSRKTGVTHLNFFPERVQVRFFAQHFDSNLNRAPEFFVRSEFHQLQLLKPVCRNHGKQFHHQLPVGQ